MSDLRATMSARDLERFHAHALTLADEARRIIRATWENGFEVKHKPDGSYVTSADVQVEERLRTLIGERFPNHGIVGEELPAHAPGAEFQWVLDPVDGTEDFVQRIPTFGTIIGLHFRGEPLVGVIDMPRLDTRVHAAFSLGAFHNRERLRLTDLDADVPPAQVRLMLSARANFIRYRNQDGAVFDTLTRTYPNHRIYRTCYAHVCAATGQADATVDYGNHVWDLAASRVVVEEAGGAYRTLQDFRTPTGRVFSAVFGRPALVAKLVSLLGESTGTNAR